MKSSKPSEGSRPSKNKSYQKETSKRGDAQNEDSAHKMLSGAVSFLDVLGWKGIWLRRSPNEVVRQLEELANLAKRTAERQRGSDFIFSELQVLNISDTVVMLTPGDPDQVLPLHGLICKELIVESIRNGIPLRGATSYGKYSAPTGTILVGPAVDEAAGWHEAADWIGVLMTPTAEYNWNPGKPWCRYERVPIKGSGNRSLWCVDWTNGKFNISDIKHFFAQASPLDPAVGMKYLNTMEFLNNSQED